MGHKYWKTLLQYHIKSDSQVTTSFYCVVEQINDYAIMTPSSTDE